WDDDASLLEPKLPVVEAEWFPIDREARLSVVSATGHVLNDDYRFASVFGSDSVTFFERFGQDAWPVADQYYAFNYPPAAAWVGGYAAFAQWDPREGREDEDWLLLLEIDSSSENGLVIMWGDAGVATFLIRREDLRQKNFSKVLYYWDSH
ncbi:MAG: YwqG family protein, partial [Pseudomonadota bacterium]